MRIRNDDKYYGLAAQGFHWLVAALVLTTIGIALYMTGLPLSPDKIKVYNLHKSIGVTILALAVLRLLWRLASPAPPLPADMAPWERRAARASHVALYGLLFAQPAIGVLHSNAASFPVVVFGVFALPAVIGPDAELKQVLEVVHRWLGRGFLGLICLHVAAALRHHFVLKDDIMRRMLPGRRA